MGKNINQESKLTDLVFSLYKHRIEKEKMISPKIFKNIKVEGKSIEHNIDIYIEFVQMNNLERTVIKTIDNIIVTAKDVWQFDNLLKDLGFFPKGVLYYNNEIDEEALNIAENRHIQVIRFDVMEETRKNLLQSLGTYLPDRNVIGDPFWVLMQVKERRQNNTGVYFVIEKFIPLFTSKKLAEAYCKNGTGYAVFGVSQTHLSGLISLVEGRSDLGLGIVRPSKSTSSLVADSLKIWGIKCEYLKEIYVR